MKGPTGGKLQPPSAVQAGKRLLVVVAAAIAVTTARADEPVVKTRIMGRIARRLLRLGRGRSNRDICHSTPRIRRA